MASSEYQIRNNKIFGVLLLLTELVLIFMFGFFITYSTNKSSSDDYFIIAALIILALAGFGFIATYVKAVSIGTITQLIIIFGLSLQLYFPFRGFWEIIKLSGSPFSPRNGDDVLPVSVTNVLNDRQVSQMLSSSPLTEFIACFISLVVAYSAVIGRIGNLETYFFTVIGTFVYEFNSMIFWRLFVTDCGYGMRIFLFGGFFGLLTSLVLGKTESTISHIRFVSNYYHQAFNLLGAIIIWSLLPVLNWSDLFHSSALTTSNDNSYLHAVSLNMWFALTGSVIGSFCVSILLYKKVSVHTIIFSIFSGGIGYSSVSDVFPNPGVAMGVGCGTSIISALLISKFKHHFNKNGVKDTNGVIGSYLVPGLIAGFLSAMFHAGLDVNKIANGDTTRTRFAQGGIQIAGLGIAIGLGIFAGCLSGIFMRCFNNRERENQFNEDFIINEVESTEEAHEEVQ